MTPPRDYRDALLALGDTYARATGRSRARVATMVRNQGAFFDRLEAGQGCTVDTFFEVLRWFRDNWPAGTDWPDGVVTPEQIMNIGLALPPRGVQAA